MHYEKGCYCSADSIQSLRISIVTESGEGGKKEIFAMLYNLPMDNVTTNIWITRATQLITNMNHMLLVGGCAVNRSWNAENQNDVATDDTFWKGQPWHAHILD